MTLVPSSSRSSGGGYTPPITQQQLTLAANLLANGASGDLAWSASSGNTLLDLTTPASPLILVAGIYAVTVEVLGNTLTAGGTFVASLDVDRDDLDASSAATSPASVASQDTPTVSLTVVGYCAAGGNLRLHVTNNDGANARDFSGTAAVQRIT